VDIIKALENLSPELLKAIAEEAHAAGKPVFAHSINGAEAVLAGAEIDSIEHSHSVAMAAVTTEEARNKLHEGRTRRSNRLTTQEVHGFMEEESYDRLIGQLVAKKVHWTPTLSTTWRAFSPRREKFKAAELKLFSLPGLSYIPVYFRTNTKEYFAGTAEIDPQLRERIAAGHRKLNDFIRRFVKAGGKLQTGSDPNSVLPGVAIHTEMELLVEAGLTPGEALVAATRNAAERVGRKNDFGAIAAGAFADIVVIDGDPLQEISATQRIDLVFKEGKPIQPGYRAGYRNPIPRPQPDRPAPEIESISPETAAEGAGPITLNLTGRNFLSTAVVKIDGKPVPAEVKFRPSRFPQNFRRGREITATVPADRLRRYGSYPIVVEHPGAGGAVSNTMHLIVKPR
jgi:imidazolonepropionase-like amidohydrolase